MVTCDFWIGGIFHSDVKLKQLTCDNYTELFEEVIGFLLFLSGIKQMYLRAFSTKENVSVSSHNVIVFHNQAFDCVVCVMYYFLIGLKCKLLIDSINTYCLSY